MELLTERRTLPRRKARSHRVFVLNKKQSHDVVIAFLYGIIKKYPTKGEFASSYISDRGVTMEENVERSSIGFVS